MIEDGEACWRAVEARDDRFDGWFVTAVVTTGIYCRPSCPARPHRSNVRFFATAAAAQAAGYRACRRCRPDATPGSPEWSTRSDVVARAVRLVADGVVDREGVGGLAARLGYGTRQLERLVRAELGTGPLALARAQRAATARLLVETTDLPMTQVAFGAGFASVRSFHATVAQVFATTPGELRRRARPHATSAGALRLRLAHRMPLWPDSLFGHLAATAVPHVEAWSGGAFRRSVRLPHGPGVVALSPAAGHVECRLELADLRDLPVAISRCRRLLDLDADPTAVDDALGADPALAAAVAAAPGRRVPGAVDGEELAVRAVLGQQVSTAAARTHAARLVLAHGEPLTSPSGGVTHLWPTTAALAEVDPATLALPATRRATFAGLVDALAAGRIDLGPGADRDAARTALAGLAGIGPWTVETVAMRAMGDPDAFLATDLGVVSAAGRLGLPTRPAALVARARRWAPWRAYAVQHLWGLGTHAVNRMPA